MTPYHRWSPAWPVLSLQKETAASFQNKPTALRLINIKPGGANVTPSDTPVHKLKSLHSHFLSRDTSKPGSVLPKPSTIPYGSPPELEGNREKVYQVEEGRGRSMCHTGHLRQTGNSALTPPSSPGLLCSLDQDLSSQKDREIWGKNKQTANGK